MTTPPLLTPEERTKIDAAHAAVAMSRHHESNAECDDLEYEEQWEEQYPEPVLNRAAYYGIIGEIVSENENETEADPAGMLMELHVALGNVLGHGPYLRIDGTYYKPNFYLAKIGVSAKARKGHGLDVIKRILKNVDPYWFDNCITSGLSSGEGLIFSLRDPSASDPIEIDRRALIIEPELSKIFRVRKRDGNTLSEYMRDAWDRSTLRTKTRKDPLKASNIFPSIIGHSTRVEINETLDDISMANGLGNRFLFSAVKRRNELPFGGNITDAQVHALAEKVIMALGKARCIGEVKFSREAARVWSALYKKGLGFPEKPGLVGSLLARGDTQTLKLALNYAAYDNSDLIGIDHLRAAYACWKYSEASTYYIFGDRVADPAERRLLDAARKAHPNGLDNAAQREATGGHRTKAVRESLVCQGLLRDVHTPAQGNGGRASVTVFAVLKLERRPSSTLALFDDEAFWSGASPLLEPLHQFEQFEQFTQRESSLSSSFSTTSHTNAETEEAQTHNKNAAPPAQIAQFAQVPNPGETPFDASAARAVPPDLLNTVTTKAAGVAHQKLQRELGQRFGPLSRRGRLCRNCLTINLTRQTPKGEQCDDCILADVRAVVATTTAQGMISGAA